MSDAAVGVDRSEASVEVGERDGCGGDVAEVGVIARGPGGVGVDGGVVPGEGREGREREGRGKEEGGRREGETGDEKKEKRKRGKKRVS